MATNSLENKKILITCGPTWVKLDDVRVLSNISTGEMGWTIAENLIEAGAKVTILEGPIGGAHHQFKNTKIKVIKFQYFDELLALLKSELTKPYDIVIHAAAVSDYKPRKVSPGKISSRLKALKLELVPTVKIINLIKKIAPNVFLVGFKLEPNMTATKAVTVSQKLFKDAQCDLVVANSVDEGKYFGFIVNNNSVSKKLTSRNAMTDYLTETIQHFY